MSRTPRIVALAAALVLPAVAVVVLLFTDPEPPRAPSVVRIGESAKVRPPSTTSAPPATTAAPTSGPDTMRLPPPPVGDDGDDSGDDDEG